MLLLSVTVSCVSYSDFSFLLLHKTYTLMHLALLLYPEEQRNMWPKSEICYDPLSKNDTAQSSAQKGVFLMLAKMSESSRNIQDIKEQTYIFWGEKKKKKDNSSIFPHSACCHAWIPGFGHMFKIRCTFLLDENTVNKVLLLPRWSWINWALSTPSLCALNSIKHYDNSHHMCEE